MKTKHCPSWSSVVRPNQKPFQNLRAEKGFVVQLDGHLGIFLWNPYFPLLEDLKRITDNLNGQHQKFAALATMTF